MSRNDGTGAGVVVTVSRRTSPTASAPPGIGVSRDRRGGTRVGQMQPPSVVDVAVVEGPRQEAGIGLERTGRERRDDEGRADERGVRRRRQVIPRRRDGPEVVDVEAQRREVALPTDDVEGMERIHERRGRPGGPDAYLELAGLVVGLRV